MRSPQIDDNSKFLWFKILFFWSISFQNEIDRNYSVWRHVFLLPLEICP
jgi:hypothetical protein